MLVERPMCIWCDIHLIHAHDIFQCVHAQLERTEFCPVIFRIDAFLTNAIRYVSCHTRRALLTLIHQTEANLLVT